MVRGADLHPKDHSIQLFTDASNEGWDAHLDQSSTKDLWLHWDKRLHINILELHWVSLALRSFKDQCQNQTMLVAKDNSTVVSYTNKQGGTHSVEMCALLWKIMTWCHHYHITLKARHILGCLNVMVDLPSRSNQVESTEWSLHIAGFQTDLPKVVHSSCRSICHSSELQTSTVHFFCPRPKCLGHRCSDALLHRVIQKFRQCHCLIIVIAPGWPGMPWFGSWYSSQQRSLCNFQCQQLFSNSLTIMSSTAIYNISTSMPCV